MIPLNFNFTNPNKNKKVSMKIYEITFMDIF